MEVTVHVDGDRIVETITNLLSNAIKFSQHGAVVSLVASEVEASFGRPHSGAAAGRASKVVVKVVDHGRGVPADRADDIFERFLQVDASDARDKGGTGLGLSICKEIIERHDGTIWVEPTPGGGATFGFSLPTAVGMTSTDGGAP